MPLRDTNEWEECPECEEKARWICDECGLCNECCDCDREEEEL